MNAIQQRDSEVLNRVREVMDDVEEADLGRLTTDISSLSGHSRTALFVAKELVMNNMTRDVDVHICHLVEMAYEALTGRYEEMEGGIDEALTRIRIRVEKLVIEQLALKKALRILSVVMTSNEAEAIAVQVRKASDEVEGRLDQDTHAEFLVMLGGLVHARGLEMVADADAGLKVGSAIGRQHRVRVDEVIQQLNIECQQIGEANQAALRPLGQPAPADAAVPLPAADGTRRKRRRAA